jgi:hypothetical protein
MHSILHINNLSEQFAHAYNLHVTKSVDEADILILRDPMDRIAEQVTDELENYGNTKGITFEEYFFLEQNAYCKMLNIEAHSDVRKCFETQEQFKFIGLMTNAIWSEDAISLQPNTTIVLNPLYSISKVNDRLAEFLEQPVVDIEDNSYYATNELDVGFRADFQKHNAMDYYLIRKIKQFLEFGDFDDSLD